MKSISIVLLFFFTINCSSNVVSNTHGIRFIDNKYDKIILNKSNKNDVRKIIGPPSIISDFDNKWIYIERKKNSQTLLKLGVKKISENNVLVLEFNNKGMLISKNLHDISDMNEIPNTELKTEKKFDQNNIVYDIFSSLREKINAGTRKKK